MKTKGNILQEIFRDVIGYMDKAGGWLVNSNPSVLNQSCFIDEPIYRLSDHPPLLVLTGWKLLLLLRKYMMRCIMKAFWWVPIVVKYRMDYPDDAGADIHQFLMLMNTRDTIAFYHDKIKSFLEMEEYWHGALCLLPKKLTGNALNRW